MLAATVPLVLLLAWIFVVVTLEVAAGRALGTARARRAT